MTLVSFSSQSHVTRLYLTLCFRFQNIDNDSKGFLPYIDEETSLDGAKAIPRNNHAIWDQLGLLHWLKHNMAAFQGDPNNIALLPLDNQAAQFVQLLTLSPLAKGKVLCHSMVKY